MTARDIYWFLRPTLGVLLCFSLAVIAAQLIATHGSSDAPADLELAEQLADVTNGLVEPSTSLTPCDVVQIQLAGLADPDSTRGVLQCMAFASPGNRTVTGPLESFAQMVRKAPFNVLAKPTAIQAGQPTYVDRHARILVTAVDGNQIQMFVWVLSQQQDSPYRDCWMTDAVFPLPSSKDPGSTTPPTSQSL